MKQLTVKCLQTRLKMSVRQLCKQQGKENQGLWRCHVSYGKAGKKYWTFWLHMEEPYASRQVCGLPEHNVGEGIRVLSPPRAWLVGSGKNLSDWVQNYIWDQDYILLCWEILRFIGQSYAYKDVCDNKIFSFRLKLVLSLRPVCLQNTALRYW